MALYISYLFDKRLLMATGLVIVLLLPAIGQKSEAGLASYYHNSLEGNKTASGEIFSQDKFTAAHKTLPFGTWVKLTGTMGKQVVVRINDRLPAHSTRLIDLTTCAAKELDMIDQGLKRVNLKVISAREAWVWFIMNGYWHQIFIWAP